MILSLIAVPALALTTPEDSMLNLDDSPIQIHPTAEIGFVGPVKHTIQFGKPGTVFDYVDEGGQDNLFPFLRMSVDLRLPKDQTLTLLYQPLNIETSIEARQDLQFNDLAVPAGTPIETRYGFDFYRMSWTKDVLDSDMKELGFGLSMQIRNATIDFVSSDGEISDTQRDIGPVPLFRTRGRFDYESGCWWGFEVDGAYAPIKYINGGTSDVVGALLDASLRLGQRGKNGIDSFVNLRYLGGGAEGTTDDPDPGEDGFTNNWLHTVSLSIGAIVR